MTTRTRATDQWQEIPVASLPRQHASPQPGGRPEGGSPPSQGGPGPAPAQQGTPCFQRAAFCSVWGLPWDRHKVTAFVCSHGALTRGEKRRMVLENITRQSDKSQASGEKMTAEGHDRVPSAWKAKLGTVSGGGISTPKPRPVPKNSQSQEQARGRMRAQQSPENTPGFRLWLTSMPTSNRK